MCYYAAALDYVQLGTLVALDSLHLHLEYDKVYILYAFADVFAHLFTWVLNHTAYIPSKNITKPQKPSQIKTETKNWFARESLLCLNY